MKKYLKSKTVWFNSLIGILALLETQTQVFASFVGPEYLPLVGFVIGAINIYLRSITTECLSKKGSRDGSGN